MASLLKTAEELKIKGLAEVSWRDDENENSENNDDNNNSVTESNILFPNLPPTSTSSSSIPHSQSNHRHNQQQISSQGTPSHTTANNNDRKEYDNKENMLKAMPFLAPLSLTSPPKDLSSSTSRKKRGRPPLDDSNTLTKT